MEFPADFYSVTQNVLAYYLLGSFWSTGKFLYLARIRALDAKTLKKQFTNEDFLTKLPITSHMSDYGYTGLASSNLDRIKLYSSLKEKDFYDANKVSGVYFYFNASRDVFLEKLDPALLELRPKFGFISWLALIMLWPLSLIIDTISGAKHSLKLLFNTFKAPFQWLSNFIFERTVN